MNTPNPDGLAPGWYRDPALPLRLRWWDGRGWTAHTRDPVPVAVPGPAPLSAAPSQATAAVGPVAVPSLAQSPSHSPAQQFTPQPVQQPVPQPDSPATDGDPFALMAAATGTIRITPPIVRPRDEQPTRPPHRRRGVGPIIGLTAATLVVAGGIVVLLLDPFSLFPEAASTAYSDKVEQALAASIEASGDEAFPVDHVVCPDDLVDVFAGEFSCDVTFDDGSAVRIVAQLADNGQTVQWSPADA